MDHIRRIIGEVHRRSLWQVLGIFLAASWGVLQVVESITESVGLPDWTPSMAFVLLLLGLPICLATAFVQEGMPGQGAAAPPTDEATDAVEESTDAPNLAAGTGSLDRPTTRPAASRRLLTWRNAVVGGLGGFTLLGISLMAYFVMWTSGIGPFGNLVAQGVIDDGERVILASFEDATGEGLGDVVTEALRVDLTEAAVLDLVEDVDIQPVLSRMQVTPGTPLDAELAREVALREGVKAVIDGEVGAAGTGYVVTATLRAAGDGRSIASFRATAEGPDDVINSIDKLSQDIREKSGETLRSIRSGEQLERVTTSSLDALRIFTESEATWDRGEDQRTIELLEQAVELDPGFAMAWRRLAALHNNLGIDPEAGRIASMRAFENRDRLTELERYLAEGYYYAAIAGDRTRTIAAYQNALRIDPGERAALNNLGNEYAGIEDYDRAIEIYRQAIDGPGRSNTAFQNLQRNEIGSGDFAGARTVYEEYREAYPGDAGLAESRFWSSFINGDLDDAVDAVSSDARDPAVPAFVRAESLHKLATVAYERGRLNEARDLMLESERVAAEISADYEFLRLNWTVYQEWAVGDADWAARRAAGAFSVFESLEPFARNHWFYGLNLSVGGNADHAERVALDYDATRTDADRNVNFRTEMKRIRLYASAATGRPNGAVDGIRAIASEFGCATCYRQEEAWLAELEGRTDVAIELHESILAGGFSFFELNGPYRQRSMLVLGPLYEEVGDTAAAIGAYQRVVERWADADERGMRAVRTAQQRIAALGG